MNFKLHRPTGILLTLGLIGLIPAIGFAADANFAGTWRAEVKLQTTNRPVGNGPGAIGLNSNSVTVPDGIGGTKTISVVPNAESGGAGPPLSQDELTGHRGGFPGPTAPATPPKPHMQTYKMILNIKIDKNGRWSGTWKVNDNRFTAQEWNVVGNKLTFAVIGAFGIPEYNCTAVWNDKELNIRQTPANGDPVREFTMKR